MAQLTKNEKLLRFVEDSAALCKPKRVIWIDGTQEQLFALRDEALATGELILLNQELLPGCVLQRH